ncbi:MAG TPA: DNA polymerase I [Candidatus Hydrogenedentes bacterium]|nr:DNA polymerase I [Candidatus Hydrogenedentota bacterium]
MADDKRLFIIDGMAYAFRSYYAIRNLRDSTGRPVNAVFGFARLLLKILREHEPTHIVMVFDAPGPTFRDELYPEYKANRDATPEDLILQFPLIDQLVEAFDIPILRVPGVEADDVMGTLAIMAEEQGLHPTLVTGDKDMLQCVTDTVKVFDPSKGDNGKWYAPADVVERYGVPPKHVIDMLGLMGDSADNVPGVRGIGEKTAKKLLEKYATMDGVYKNIDDLKGKQKEKLIEDKEKAYLSLELVTIKTDVTLDDDLEAFARKELDNETLSGIFAEFEFRGLTQEFLPESVKEEEEVAQDYKLILSTAQLKKVVKEMEKSGEFAVDTETTSVDPITAGLVGISLSCKDHTGYYIPLAHTQDDLLAEPIDAMIPMPEALNILRPLLENPEIGKIGHNIKYDAIVLANAGIGLEGITLDTMLASYLTDASRVRHNLGEVSLKYLRCKMIPISDVIGTGSKAITFDKVPLGVACEYAAEDADITWRLSAIFQKSLKQGNLEDLFNEVELPLLHVLMRMEMKGIAINAGVFEELREEIEKRFAVLETEIHELAGSPFQINSPKQLQKVLFEDLGLPTKKKTKTGYSTDVSVLEELAHEHPLPEKMLEYRMLEKLRNTYVTALPNMVNAETGRIHTSFNQAVAATGRLSSSNPNLQNIPVRTDMGRRIRQGFIPGEPGMKLISADYSQIELRLLAHLTRDEALLQAFRDGRDVHSDTAARVFGVELDAVTGDMRRQAKAVNFGVVYGISAFGLARNIGISNREAATFIENYFAQYPNVKIWIDETVAEARERGYVTTLMNRRRYIPEINGSDVQSRKGAERIAMNTPVQGTAADIIKVAMINVDKELEGSGASLLLQVHDELLIEAPEASAESTAETVRNLMETAMTLDVALEVEVGIGDHWAEIH